MAKRLGLPQWKAKRIFEGLRAGLGHPVPHPTYLAKARARPPAFHLEEEEGRARVEGVTPHQDLEAFLRENGVDLEVWEVERWVVNRWEMGALVDGALTTQPLYQIKAWLRRKGGPEADRAFLEELFGALAERAPTLPPPPVPRGDGEPRMAVLAAPDIHVGKLAWGEETGENYDTRIALSLWRESTRALLARLAAYPHETELLLLPLGNDLFHVDSMQNTTTSGTRVDVDSRWQRAFRLVAEFVVEEIIEAARKVAPRVEVIMVPGNHDHQRTFYLGELLRVFYAKTPGIRVQNAPTPRKYRLWRQVLLGWTHGHRGRHRDLPLLMAVEASGLWGHASWREWQVGHYHARKQYHYMPLVDERGVIVRVLPALSGTDAWHAEMGFIGSKRAASLIVYHPEGEEAAFHYPVRPGRQNKEEADVRR